MDLGRDLHNALDHDRDFCKPLRLKRRGSSSQIASLLACVVRAQSTEDAENATKPHGEEISSALTMMMQLGKWLVGDSSPESRSNRNCRKESDSQFPKADKFRLILTELAPREESAWLDS